MVLEKPFWAVCARAQNGLYRFATMPKVMANSGNDPLVPRGRMCFTQSPWRAALALPLGNLCKPRSGMQQQPEQPSVAPWLRLAGQLNRSPLGRLSVRRSCPLLPRPMSSALFLQKSAPCSSWLRPVFIKTFGLYKASGSHPRRPWCRHLPGAELRGYGERK